ncbi:MAG: hypothetical protein WD738_05260 [Pirellulales bacterium]
MHLKFSLRTLFLMTTVVAAGCYELVRPTLIAQQFISATDSKDYERADTCFRDTGDRCLFDLNEKHWRFLARAELQPWSFRQFMRGERLLTLSVAYGDAGPMRSRSFTVIVSRAGLLMPQPAAFGGGFGVGGIANH